MERKIVVEKLTGIFRRVFNSASLELRDDMTANDIENWDSLTHMILIAEIETAFKVKFKLKELNKMRNVGEMSDLLLQKIL